MTNSTNIGWTYTDGSDELSADLTTVAKTVPVSVTFDGGNADITTGIPKPMVRVPYSCTVIAWYLNADVSGSIVIDVQRASSGSPTSFSTIAGSELPTLSAAQSASDTSLTTWTTSLSAGDWLKFIVNSATAVDFVALQLVTVRA